MTSPVRRALARPSTTAGRLFRCLLPCVLAVFAASAGALAADGPGTTAFDAAVREVATELEVASVELDGRPLFRIVGLASTLPAKNRAERVAARIAALADDPTADASKIRIEQVGMARAIHHGSTLVVTVTEPDAALSGLDVDTVALVYTTRIGEAIGQYREERKPANLRAAAFRVAGVVAGAFLLVAFLLWGLGATDRALDRRYHHRIQTVGIQSFELVRAERIRGAISGAIALLRLAIVAVALFVLLDYGLMQFPWTRQAGTGMLSAVLAPLRAMGSGLVAQIPNVAFLVVLVVIVRFLLKLVRLFFEAVGRGQVAWKDFDPEWAEPTYKLLRLVVVGFALIVAYPYIPGSSSDAFKGISIFVGVVFSLASTTAISNLIAGYALIYRRAFKVGDRIRVGDTMGVVTRSRLQVTHLRTVKNEEVIVPNAALLNGTIVNYSTLASGEGLVVSVAAGIGYETPWRQVEAMLLMAAERTEGLLREPKPFVWHQSLGDFCVNYELNAYIADALAAPVARTALSRNVLDVFNEYGVQIMTPAYRGDPEEPKIVRREDWHLPPASPAEGTAVQGQGTAGGADAP